MIKEKHFSQLTFSPFKKMDERKQLNILISCSDDSISFNLFRNAFPSFLKKDQVQSYLSIHFRFVYVQIVCNYSIKLDTCLACWCFLILLKKLYKLLISFLSALSLSSAYSKKDCNKDFLKKIRGLPFPASFSFHKTYIKLQFQFNTEFA